MKVVNARVSCVFTDHLAVKKEISLILVGSHFGVGDEIGREIFATRENIARRSNSRRLVDSDYRYMNNVTRISVFSKNNACNVIGSYTAVEVEVYGSIQKLGIFHIAMCAIGLHLAGLVRAVICPDERFVSLYGGIFVIQSLSKLFAAVYTGLSLAARVNVVPYVLDLIDVGIGIPVSTFAAAYLNAIYLVTVQNGVDMFSKSLSVARPEIVCHKSARKLLRGLSVIVRIKSAVFVQIIASISFIDIRSHV